MASTKDLTGFEAGVVIPPTRVLLYFRGKLHLVSVVINIVVDDDGVVSRILVKQSSIVDILIHIVDNGSLQKISQGKHVTHSQIGLLFTVNELSRASRVTWIVPFGPGK